MGALTFQPLLPGSAWLILLIACTGAMVWYSLRRPSGISRGRWGLIVALMSGAMTLVLALLLNPTWTRQIDSPMGRPRLTILVDSARSMATPDEADSQTRYMAAVSFAGRLSGTSDFDVHLMRFDSIARVADSNAMAADKPLERRADLAGAIQAALDADDSQGQAIVMLSDGIQVAPGGAAVVLQAARLARSLESPVYTHTFGQTNLQASITIQLRSPQDVALVGQTVPVSAIVTHKGIVGSTTMVTLLRDGTEVDRKQVELDAAGPSQVNFLLRHQNPGIYSYQLYVQPAPAQSDLAGTTADYVLRVVNEPIRILLLEGKPYWDSKFLIRTLSSDPAVALVAVTRISDSRILCRTLSHLSPSTRPDGKATDTAGIIDTWKLLSDPKEPLSSLDRLQEYQLVFLGRDVGPFLDDNAIANLQTWVSRQGGSLICFRGDPTDQPDPRLEKLLPVVWAPAAAPSRFRVLLTSQGRDLNWLGADTPGGAELADLPSLATSDTVSVSKPLAVVLAEQEGSDGDQAPVLVYHPYGAGRVVAIQGAGMWRWAFLPPKFQDEEVVYADLWQSMLRWLTSGDRLQPGEADSLRPDRVRFTSDQPATLTLLLRQDNQRRNVPMVELSPSSRLFAPSPLGAGTGAYRVDLGELPPGNYSARIAGTPADDIAAHVAFEVVDFDDVMNLEARPDLMARIARDSGGAVLGSDDPLADLMENFKAEFAREHPPRVVMASAWDRWWMMAAALSIWTISWSIRRAGGLI